MTDGKNAERLQRLMSELADSLLELSEEEVIAEQREAGFDPMQEAAEVRDLLRPVRVLIADDYQIFRETLRQWLDSESDLKVIGEACDGADAVKLVRQLEPDILLLDLRMPKHPGLEALKELSVGPRPTRTRVILLTAAVERHQVVEALHLGARGVVLKDSITQTLLKAIQIVMAGGYWVGKERVADLVQYLRSLLQSSSEYKRYGLTDRELHIISAVVVGRSNNEIATHFKISEDLVNLYLNSSFDKLRVSTRLELALFAVDHSVPLPGLV